MLVENKWNIMKRTFEEISYISKEIIIVNIIKFSVNKEDIETERQYIFLWKKVK